MDRDALATVIGRLSYLQGSFVLRSGRTASEYFDKYRFESDPVVLGAIAEMASPLIPEDTQVLAGLELGGVPIATALSLSSKLPAVFVRKEAKAYGTRRLAEGMDVAGKRVLVVEDVITSGGQVALSTESLRERGGIVTDVFCVVDREEGGAENLASHGLRLRALFRGAELRVATVA
ncbi:MAG: orotate phosphoribosyltransferase [Streptosporangiaceae bacterium]|nr:orotate phosphoribosyltransferase [Streptosporangiaceae bacterium]